MTHPLGAGELATGAPDSSELCSEAARRLTSAPAATIVPAMHRERSQPKRRRGARFCRAGLLGAALLLSFAGVAQANTIAVSTTADPAGSGSCPGSPCSLRQAIASAGPGDTIELGGSGGSPAVYEVTQGTPILINKQLTIEGKGTVATTLSGSSNRPGGGELNRIMKITAGPVTISGLSFSGGTDGEDEKFSSCGGPCYTLTANGGGALFNEGATVSLEDVDFHSDLNSPVGGAVANTGSLTLTDVTFANDGAAFGGGLFSRSGTVTAEGVTFREDGGFDYGGGAVMIYGGTATLTNTTVVNSGTASSRGGGIENRGGTLTLRNDTLAGNLRGSLQTDVGATTTVQNTIIASGFDDFGSDYGCVAEGKTSGAETTTAKPITTDLGHNIDQDGACELNATGDQSRVDPRLAPIAANGGPTPTEALLHGSAAIGAADDPSCPATDQRGVARPQGTHCDVGAFEAQTLGAPSALTEAASGASASEITLHASINLAGEAGGFHFIYGTSAAALSDETPEVGAGVLASATAESETVGGLSAGTTYYFRAVADNASGSATAAGNALSFTTSPGPPVLSNVTIAAVTDTSATVEASIDPAGSDTSYEIEYGFDESYGQSTAPVDLGSSAGPQAVSKTITGLEPNHIYHLNLVASNSLEPAGVKSGDLQFQTEAAAQHSLSVSLAGSGGGSVSGEGINCPGTCSGSYAVGTVVVLKALAASGSTFSGWSGSCAGGRRLRSDDERRSERHRKLRA